MRLLRFLLWLRKKQRPLSVEEQWRQTRQELQKRAVDKKPNEPVWDWRGRCRACGRPKDTHTIRWC